MNQDFQSLLEAWNGLGVLIRFDRPTRTWIFIALHDNSAGVMVGGTRMKVYASSAHALKDALRLAEGMTYKWSGLDLPFGGGKTVLAIEEPLNKEQLEGLLARYGKVLNSLEGAYLTAADLGLKNSHVKTLAASSRHIFGFDYQKMESTDPGPYTARGVLCGMQSALEHVFGTPSLSGRIVLVQGVGGVGAPLARLLARQGARLLLSDINIQSANRLAAELKARTVRPSKVYETECDIFAPCAIGGILNTQTIAKLKCRIIAGSANNQLAEPANAYQLNERRILYTPDFLLNAGGALALALLHQGANSANVIDLAVDSIGESVTHVLEKSAADSEPPQETAEKIAMLRRHKLQSSSSPKRKRH